ncbi:MAG: MFS transporter [Firmicutes bacterium]|nr:MFS transporter [Bacillota bacterium]
MVEPSGQSETVSRSYLTLLVTLVTIGVLMSAFDSVARNDALPLILKYLHMSVAEGGLVLSGGFVATTLSNLAIGPLMDRFGRKNLFIAALVATALTSGFTAFVTNVVEYAVIGFLAGVCLSVIGTGNVLVAEEAPRHIRGMLQGIVTAGFPMGTVVIGLVGSLVLPSGHWRILFLLSFSSILLALVVALTLREPPRSAEALQVKRHRRDIERGQTIQTRYSIDEHKAVRQEFWQIFAPDLRRQTITTSLFGFLVNFSVGFVIVLGVTFMVYYDHIGIGIASLALLVEGAATIVGEIVVGLLADRWVSRNILILWNIIGGIAVGLFAVHGGEGWLFFIMALFGFFGQGYQGTWWRYLNDSFPTRARGTGSSFVTGIYFFGLVFAPSIFGAVMTSGHYALVPVICAAIVIVGTLVLLFARKIEPQKDLEDIAS